MTSCPTRWWSRVATPIVAIGCALQPGSTMAFKLNPHASDTENRVRFLERSRIESLLDRQSARLIDHFSSPVHEELTHRIYGCSAPADQSCVDPLPWGTHAPQPVLFGVQWNDNPPFQVTSTSVRGCPTQTTIRLPNFSSCWFKLFLDAEKRAGEEDFDGDSGVALIYRVHFGDLQFLHSMGAWNGQSARDTKEYVMAWAELMYRVSIGDIRASTRLTDTGIDVVKDTFRANGWTIEGLLTLGQEDRLKRAVNDVAFGSLLHMVQDSFAAGHVDRDEATASSTCHAGPAMKKAGDIREFHSYVGQDKDKHGAKDARGSMEAHLAVASPSVVEIGRSLVELRSAGAPWSTVRPYFDECVFPLPDTYKRHPAGPGALFRS
jgi:hypothetical protein